MVLEHTPSTTHNLFIVQTPYHIMISCEKACSGDYLLSIGSIAKENGINRLVNACFEKNRFIEISSMSDFKEHMTKLVFFRHNLKKQCAMLKSWEIETIFAFNDTNPIVQWIINNIDHKETIILDEGIGLYRDVVKRKEMLFAVFGNLIFGGDFENINRMGTSKQVSAIECRYPDRLNTRQGEKQIRVCAPLDMSGVARKAGIIRRRCDNWFIGQPLVEDGVMNEAQYLNQIERIISYVDSDRNKWLIKPHPREKMEKYHNLNVLREIDLPIELLIDNSVATSVCTIYSSAVLNLANIANIQCMSFCYIDNKPLVDGNIIELFKMNGVAVINI